MDLISPVNMETCRAYIGRPVCVILQDGTYMIGTLSGVSESGIHLNGGHAGEATLSTKAKVAQKELNHLGQKALTSAYGPAQPYPVGGYNYGYAASRAFAWTAIALLFLIPFLFI